MTELYQKVLLVPENVLHNFEKRISELEKSNAVKEKHSVEVTDVLIPYDKAALFLGLDRQSLIRARNEGRIRGIKNDGRSYSYRMSELEDYKKRHGRTKDKG